MYLVLLDIHSVAHSKFIFIFIFPHNFYLFLFRCHRSLAGSIKLYLWIILKIEKQWYLLDQSYHIPARDRDKNFIHETVIYNVNLDDGKSLINIIMNWYFDRYFNLKSFSFVLTFKMKHDEFSTAKSTYNILSNILTLWEKYIFKLFF